MTSRSRSRTTWRTALGFGAITAAVAGALLAPSAPAVGAADNEAAAAAALPGTIVFLRGHNVWVARADGTGQTQVTRDGTAEHPYRSPSQSDNGVIAAGHRNHLVTMRQNGTVLNRLDPPPLLNSVSHPMDGPPHDVAISPDGTKIAWTFTSYTCPVGTSCGARAATGITDADRLTPVSKYGTSYLSHPSWVGNRRTLQSGGYLHQINLHDLGGTPFHWFDDQDVAGESTDLGDAELSPDGRYLAAVRGYGNGTHLVWYRVNGNAFSGPKPPLPTWLCLTGELPGYADPTWSPDSAAFAWEEPDGIWLKRGPADCAMPTLHIRNASQPDWSAAPLNTAKPKPPAATPKAFTVLKRPAISGKPRVGKRLKASRGRWSPAPTRVSYRWLRNGKPIRGATSRTYRLTRKDARKRISVRVTVRRPGLRATSAKSATVKIRPKKRS